MSGALSRLACSISAIFHFVYTICAVRGYVYAYNPAYSSNLVQAMYDSRCSIQLAELGGDICASGDIIKLECRPRDHYDLIFARVCLYMHVEE